MGKPIVRALKRIGWGKSVVCLQEVPKWIGGSVFEGHIVHASRSKADLANNRDGFDCGFLVPVSLNPLIRDEIHRPYWSGLLFPRLIVFSVHFLHKNFEDDSDSHISAHEKSSLGHQHKITITIE